MTKAIQKKGDLRESLQKEKPEDLQTVLAWVNEGKSILPLMPILYRRFAGKDGDWKTELGKHPEVIAAIDANFVLRLTKAILPEYHSFILSKKTWLEAQIAAIRKEIGV